jgi:myo-inositol-1(or 4)-monophosphatase
MTASTPDKQLLHLVIGGELKNIGKVEFKNLSEIHFVGAYPNYRAAYDAWKAAAQRTIDNAHMRYFILHAHRLLDPETGKQHDA